MKLHMPGDGLEVKPRFVTASRQRRWNILPAGMRIQASHDYIEGVLSNLHFQREIGKCVARKLSTMASTKNMTFGKKRLDFCRKEGYYLGHKDRYIVVFWLSEPIYSGERDLGEQAHDARGKHSGSQLRARRNILLSPMS
jgi:hypothetical protein